jgi:hypothetical protein
MLLLVVVTIDLDVIFATAIFVTLRTIMLFSCFLLFCKLKAWLNFNDFGKSDEGCLVINKLGAGAFTVVPVVFKFNLRDLCPARTKTVCRTWIRAEFNVVTLGANLKAKVKFSTNYNSDVTTWPRTPSDIDTNDPKTSIAIFMCRDVISHCEQGKARRTSPSGLSRQTYIAAKRILTGTGFVTRRCCA